MGKAKAIGVGGCGEKEGRLGPETEVPDCFWSDMDPDGSMSERPDYWQTLPPPEPPTRMAWLRHRLRQAAALVGAAQPDPNAEPRLSHAEWTRLSEQALGPLPQPGDYADRKQARSATPNARKPARKPAAYSPERTSGASEEGRGVPETLGATQKVDA